MNASPSKKRRLAGFRDAPILVTGACGRIAGRIVRRLAESSRYVLATDRSPPPADRVTAWGSRHEEYVEFVQAELTDLTKIASLVQRACDIVHVGAVPGPSQHPPPGVDPSWQKTATIGLETITGLELLQQNFMGSCGLFEAAAAQRDGRRVVFSSSLFAMGWSHDPASFQAEYLPLDEAHPPLSTEHYGLSKALAEDFASMLVRVEADEHKGPSFVLLRFSNIIKEERWSEFPSPAPESVTPLMWAYCHELDVVEAHLQALSLPNESLPSRCESFFIVADDTRHTIPTCDLIRRRWPHHAPRFNQPLPGWSSIVSNAKAKRILGFKPRSLSRVTPHKGVSESAGGTRDWSTFDVPQGFTLASGEHLDGAFVAYKMHGALNADKSNVILHPTSFDAAHWELEYNIGPGKMLDTSKYCVLVVNLLGNGVSFSPSTCSARKSWPVKGVTVCDNVRLQAMLLDSLQIHRVALIYGYSMGAMQALHWGVMYPDRVLRIAAVCGAAKAHPYNIVFLESLKAALLTDPDLKQGEDGRLWLRGSCRSGLKTFARIYAGWGMCMEFYRQELWRTSSRDGKAFENLEDFVSRSYDAGFAGGHPLNLLAQVETWKAGDVSKAPGQAGDFAASLAKIKARVYLLPSTTDTYFTVKEVREEAELMPNCRFVPIESFWGHRAGDPHRPGQDADAAFLAAKVTELLREEV